MIDKQFFIFFNVYFLKLFKLLLRKFLAKISLSFKIFSLLLKFSLIFRLNVASSYFFCNIYLLE
jgi:hypothetical protein